MTIKIKPILSVAFALAIMTLLGCGGGGGGTAAPGNSQPITISGVAAKGPINGGNIKVYDVKNGKVDFGTVLGSGNTAMDGSGGYSVTLNSAPAGPVVVEVSGGSYTDEASGTPAVALNIPLRAVVSSVADGAKIAVTPMTNLAFEQVDGIGAYTTVEIDDANTQIGAFFGIKDIIKSLPFDPTQPVPAGAIADQIKYAGILGVYSQLVNDRKGAGTLEDARAAELKELVTELKTNGGFSQATVDKFNIAINNYIKGGRNRSGVVPTSIAFNSGVLQLITTGTLPAATFINGIDCTITLPAGVTVKSDPATGDILAGVVASVSLAATNSFVTAKYDKAAGTVHIILLNVQPGFAIGEFAHLEFDGYPVGKAAFGVKLNRIDGGSGITSAPLTGITIRSTFAGL
ncbi:MAG: hypothetical protein PVSMB11_01240 [Desulfuromonadaceae bacterium]